MIMRQLLHESIAAASYLIGCVGSGEAAIVDPGLPAETYVLLAADRGLRITSVIETHFHADYISTGRAVARLTGATIYMPSRDDSETNVTGCRVLYDHVRVHDGDVLTLGNIRIQALHTPGHTPEHMSYIVTDTPRADQPWFVLTGDCLFVGDVGRADLVDLPMTGPHVLYASIQRLRALPAETEIYPAHYGGSACGGKAMSGKLSSTVGFESRYNWALQYTDAHTFADEVSNASRMAVDSVLRNRNTNRGVLPLPDDYYAARMVSEQPHRPAQLAALTPQQASQAVEQGAVLIDLRTQMEFAASHPRNAINITYNKDILQKRVAQLTAADERIVTLASTPFVAQAAAALLAEAGRNPVAGYIDAESAAWAAAGLPTSSILTHTIDDLHRHVIQDDRYILDVREPFEWEKGVIEGAHLLSLGDVRKWHAEIPRDCAVLVVCESGTRASAATSALHRLGYQHAEMIAPEGMSDYIRRYPTSSPVAHQDA